MHHRDHHSCSFFPVSGARGCTSSRHRRSSAQAQRVQWAPPTGAETAATAAGNVVALRPCAMANALIRADRARAKSGRISASACRLQPRPIQARTGSARGVPPLARVRVGEWRREVLAPGAERCTVDLSADCSTWCKEARTVEGALPHDGLDCAFAEDLVPLHTSVSVTNPKSQRGKYRP
jgi:hypothetical protein